MIQCYAGKSGANLGLYFCCLMLHGSLTVETPCQDSVALVSFVSSASVYCISLMWLEVLEHPYANVILFLGHKY